MLAYEAEELAKSMFDEEYYKQMLKAQSPRAKLIRNLFSIVFLHLTQKN
jgi:hypothetical protein